MNRALHCHPASRRGAVLSLHARARRAAGGIAVRFILRADLDRLRIPEHRLPRRRDGLWRHTCFEIFVSGRARAYREYDLSPSGEWAAYGFSAYRKRTRLRLRRPRFRVLRGEVRLMIDARVRGGSRVGLSAVIEEKSGAVSYWALRHPPGKPDFHPRRALALELA